MIEMETGTALKHRLIKIYEKGDEGDRTLIYVGRTAKSLEKYVEGIYTFEKVEQVVKTKVQQYMYGKGLEKFEFEMDEKEYETIREANQAKAAINAKETLKFYSTRNPKKVKEEYETKYFRRGGKMLVFKVNLKEKYEEMKAKYEELLASGKKTKE